MQGVPHPNQRDGVQYNVAAVIFEAPMKTRLWPLLGLLLTLALPSFAKDKKAQLPDYVLRAQTVLVVIDRDAGEPLDQPNANALARENVEKALSEWGRFRLVMDGQESDLIISVRTGNNRAVRPTIKGGPIDQRGGVAQGTDSTVRIGGGWGQNPNSQPRDPIDQGPHVSNEVGPSDDMFAVYRGGIGATLESTPVWRYIRKDCLRPTPQVPAVEEFRKMVAVAEKAQASKKP